MVRGGQAQPLKPLHWGEPIQKWHTLCFTSHQLLRIVCFQSNSYPCGSQFCSHTASNPSSSGCLRQATNPSGYGSGKSGSLAGYDYRYSSFPCPVWKAGVRKSRIKFFFCVPAIEVGINLDKHQGCHRDQRNWRAVPPQAAKRGKVEEQRTFDEITSTTATVPVLALCRKHLSSFRISH